MAGNTVAITVTAADRASSALKGIQGNAEALKSKLLMLGAAAGAAAGAFVSFNAVKDAISSTAELGQAVNKLSRETGLAAEDASRLLFAFKHVGMDAAAASKSLGIFSKNMTTIAEAEEGEIKASKTTVALLKEMGIQALDSSGNVRPMSELLYEVADQFKAMPNGIEKTGTAMQMFGRSGKDMIPLLNLGSDGMQELAKTADKLGVTLSAANLQKVKDYTYAQRDMKEAMAGLKLQIGLELLPALTKLSTWFVDHQPQIRAFETEGIAKVREGMTDLSPVLRQAADDLPRVGDALKDIGNWTTQNSGTLAFGLGAIGLGLAWANPLVGLAVGATAIVGAIELMRTPIEKLPRPMLEADLAVLKLTDGLTNFTESLMDFLTIWQAIPGVNKIRFGNLMGKMEDWEKKTNELQDSIVTKTGEVQAALDAMDASDAVAALGNLKQKGDLLSQTFASMADTGVASMVTLNQMTTAPIRGDIDKLTSAAHIARDAAKDMVNAWNQALRDSTGIFQQIARHIDEQATALQSLPWTPPRISAPTPAPTSRHPLAYQHGGIVPGPFGRPQWGLLHGGEEVLTATDRRSGSVINNYHAEFHISIEGSSEEALRKFEQVMNNTLRRAGYGGSSISAGAFIPA